MIRNSFIFLDGVSKKTEQNIWAQGICSWNDFLSCGNIKGISKKRKILFDNQIQKAKQALVDYDASHFLRLPKSDMWRLYDFFSDDVIFIDIETSGYYGDITVIGMYDGVDTRTMVQGFNLDKQALKDLLSHYKLIVTFNGLSFDVPMINRFFNTVVPDVPHIDLRFALARLGYVGGLKKIEKELGIRREDDVADMSGGDAINLWHMWKATGERVYLDLVVKYNEEDVINLKPLAEFVSKKLNHVIFLDN